jgi:hypothetical protein
MSMIDVMGSHRKITRPFGAWLPCEKPPSTPLKRNAEKLTPKLQRSEVAHDSNVRSEPISYRKL